MNMTSTAATMTQVVSIAGMASLRVGSMTAMVEREARSVMRPAYRIRRPGFVPVYYSPRSTIRALTQLGQLVRVHAEEAVRVAGRRPDALVVEERLVEQDGEIVPEGRHAADREARGGANLVGLGLPDLGHVERVGDLLDVDAVLPGGHADHRVAVGHEHDRLRDLSLLAADGGGRVRDRPRGGLQPLHLHLDPQVARAFREPVSHARTAWAGLASTVSSTPASAASSASDSWTSFAKSSRSHITS